MRNKFEEQLNELNQEMIVMGAMCEEAITSSLEALLTGEEAKRLKVFDLEDGINQKEREIESLCMKLLLQQQPVAKDLRSISSALKMISDMERIGDQASDIAELIEYVKDYTSIGMTHIKNMSDAAIHMVTVSVDSYVKKNEQMAKDVIEYDDVVDHLFNAVKTDLVEVLRKDPLNSEACLDLLMIAKYLERIGDHATNIAEWVLYSIHGTHEFHA